MPPFDEFERALHRCRRIIVFFVAVALFPACGSSDFSDGTSSTTSGAGATTAGAGSTTGGTGSTTTGSQISVTNSAFFASPITAVADGTTPISLTIVLHDHQNNPVPSAVVTFASTGSESFIYPEIGYTSSLGALSVSIASSKAEVKTVTASIGSVTLQTSVTFVPGPASRVTSSVAVNPNCVIADGNSAGALVVTVVDAHNNPIEDQNVTLASTGFNDIITPASGTTNAGGLFTAYITSTAAQTKTVTATFGLASAQTMMTFASGPTSTVNSTLTAHPASVVADGNSTVTLAMAVVDSNNNPVIGQNVTFSSTGSANTFDPTGGITDASGLFTATLKSTKAQTKTVTAAFGSASARTTVLFTAGPPSGVTSTLTVDDSSFVANGSSAFTFTVTVVDIESNPVAGQNVTFASTGSDNTFTPSSGVTNASGLLTATLTSTTAESKSVTATFGSESARATVVFTAGPPSSVRSSIIAHPASVVADGNSTAIITVAVVDANNNPVAGQNVILSSTGSYNTFTPSTGTSDASGAFTSTLRSTAVEPKTITATFGVADAQTTVSFTAGAPSGTTSTIVASPNSLIADSRSTSALTVTVLDARSNPVIGQSVSFATPNGFGSFSPASCTTNASGRCTVAMLSGSGGIYNVTATVQALNINTTVTFLNMFQNPTNYNVGSVPFSVISGDFNGDGKLDLATANRTSNTVSILIGNGDGTFRTAANYVVGTAPQSVAVGDLSGDGKLDLVTANQGSDNASILIGNGDGTFRSYVNYSAGTEPFSVALGDFNGDGKLDLAATNHGSDTVSVLLGNGDGSVRSAINYVVGTNPYAITVKDLNMDGKLDLASANQYSDNVSILLGIGDGTFQAAANYTVLSNPDSVLARDFNGDGTPDLIVADGGDFYASVLLGNGDGSFQPAVHYEVGRAPQSVAADDYNGDGKIDAVAANYFYNSVTILLGNGDGTFVTQSEYSVGTYPIFVIDGDFDGNGKSDLAVANYGSNNVSVLLAR